MIRSTLPAVAMLVLLAGTLRAQDPYAPVAPFPLGDVLLTLPTSHIPARGTWEVKFTHRFNQPIDEGEWVHSLFGLDSGANVTMGLSYVPRDDVQLAVARSNVLDTIEASAKYVVVQQAPAIPITVTLRGGAAWRTERNVDDRSSWFGQAIVSRQFGRRVALYAMPTLVTGAGRAVSGEASAALFRHAFNVPVGVSFMIQPATSLIAEVIPVNRDLPGSIDSELSWALGVKRAIGGHYFEILLTNNNATTVDQYVTSTYQGGPLRRGDIQLGFNIERRFGRNRRP
ncbi:MAG TPA: DUF5777 family beta-barrel protein [Thermoanaerobaculia bacterium]|nr:DUF5777 family beta-barrel protein [Thermoanaerobaculia bacterium]